MAAPMRVANNKIAHSITLVLVINASIAVVMATSMKPMVSNSFSPRYLSAILPRGISINIYGKSMMKNIIPILLQPRPMVVCK